MPSRFPKATSDIKVWGLTLNDSLRLLQLTNKINITANSNNPPTVKAGTMFTFYRTDTYLTPLSPATGNNVYPVNTSITYPINDVIFETTDRTFTWNNGGFPAIANSRIYYLHCSGGEDTDATSQGKGVYGASTVAPTYDTTKQGWYNASGKVLCRFYVDGSGNVLPGSICHYSDDLVAELYTTTTGAPAFSSLDIVKDGGKYLLEYRLTKDNSNPGLYLHINGDTTAGNYQSEATRGSQVLASVTAPQIYAALGNWTELTGKTTIHFIGGRFFSETEAAAGLVNNSAYWSNMRDLGSGSLRTNITAIALYLTSGAWVAGSDVRLYRGKK